MFNIITNSIMPDLRVSSTLDLSTVPDRVSSSLAGPPLMRARYPRSRPSRAVASTAVQRVAWGSYSPPSSSWLRWQASGCWRCPGPSHRQVRWTVEATQTGWFLSWSVVQKLELVRGIDSWVGSDTRVWLLCNDES